MAEKKNTKIEQTLKKLADDTWKANSQNSSSIESQANRTRDLPGDPDCPYCHGLGYLRLDVPVDHPEFGKIHICSCRQEQVSQQVRQRLFELSHLDELGHLTFENFQPRGRVGLSPKQADSLEYAYNQSQRFAQNLEGWLVLQGSFGCGKTHLAAAIANFTVNVGVPTLFITVPDLLDSLRFAYSDPQSTFEGRFDQIRQAPLLILDDFGTQNATSWAQEKLFQIINYRYINRLPLVVTTNLSDHDIEERIQSRLNHPDLVTVVKILAPDHRNPAVDIGYHELSSLDLFPGKTFTNFSLRKNETGIKDDDLHSLEKAFHAAQKFAQNPQGWLVLIGAYGSGKTHLAAAIGNYVQETALPPLMIAVPDLLDHLRATFSPNSSVTLDRRFEDIRHTFLLILDDLGTQSSTPWVKEKLHQLFDHRYNAELPTVITSSVGLEEMDPRLRSRMLDRRICEIYAITVPPFTGGPRSKSSTSTRRKHQ
jgi:DNA replication protein DnaC